MPKDFGIIALITIFINLSNILLQRGFTSALIQNKDVDEIDFSTVFFISIAGSCLLYFILFFSAPFIADFYKSMELSIVLRVLAISLPFSAVNSVQIAFVSRNMQFKKLFFSRYRGNCLFRDNRHCDGSLGFCSMGTGFTTDFLCNIELFLYGKGCEMAA